MQRRDFLLLLTAAGLAPGLAWGRDAGQDAGQGRPAAAPAFASDRIVVETRGARGPDVILVPGLASTSAVWARTAERLGPTHRVHLVSVKGFGPLAPGANAEGLVSQPTALELRRYVAERGLARPAVIGHSMGGQIALRLAAMAGSQGGAQVGRVMVVDAAPFFPALISERATVGDVEPLARLAYQTIRMLGDEALRAHGAALGQNWGRDLGGAADVLFGAMGWQGGDRRTLAQALYEVMTADLRPRLPQVTAPVTVAYGWSPRDDSPRARVDALFRAGFGRLPRPARFERIEGAEHMVMIDQPARFHAAVERFLA